MTRNLSGLVSVNDIIPASEYMQSIIFVIPESEESAWINEYETLLPIGAIPRSARALHRDDGYILYVIVVMKKFVEEYVKTAASKKFIARLDFEIYSEQQTQEVENLSKLESDVKNQWVRFNQDAFLIIIVIVILDKIIKDQFRRSLFCLDSS